MVSLFVQMRLCGEGRWVCVHACVCACAHAPMPENVE